MNPGDMVYYLYTGKNGTPIKFAALVLGIEKDGILIRVGRFDVHSRQVSTFDALVAADLLQARSVPCAFEDMLQGDT